MDIIIVVRLSIFNIPPIWFINRVQTNQIWKHFETEQTFKTSYIDHQVWLQDANTSYRKCLKFSTGADMSLLYQKYNKQKWIFKKWRYLLTKILPLKAIENVSS